MNTFLSLSHELQGLLLLWNILLIWMLIYSLVRLIQKKNKVRHIAVNILTIIAAFLHFELLLNFNINRKEMAEVLPVWMIFALLITLSLICFIQITLIINDQRKITPASIKESIDILPAGICCYYPGGLCKLVNEKIDWICREITGNGLRDGETFWYSLTTGNFSHGTPIQTGNSPIVILPGGNVINFSRNELAFDGVKMFEIIAVDVTEEYKLTAELGEKQTSLQKINQRLRDLGDKITELTTEKEILNSKIRLHDNWSHTLLASKRYLKNPSSIDKQTIYRLWDKNISLLADDVTSSYQEIYAEIFRSAQALGLKVNISGTLPRQIDNSHIIAQAMTTALSNLVRHAHGTELYMTSAQSSGKYLLTFTNNGDPPAQPIRETGGLANLRRRVENAGGKMEIIAAPQFELKIELGDKENGIQSVDR